MIRHGSSWLINSNKAIRLAIFVSCRDISTLINKASHFNWFNVGDLLPPFSNLLVAKPTFLFNVPDAHLHLDLPSLVVLNLPFFSVDCFHKQPFEIRRFVGKVRRVSLPERQRKALTVQINEYFVNTVDITVLAFDGDLSFETVRPSVVTNQECLRIDWQDRLITDYDSYLELGCNHVREAHADPKLSHHLVLLVFEKALLFGFLPDFDIRLADLLLRVVDIMGLHLNQDFALHCGCEFWVQVHFILNRASDFNRSSVYILPLIIAPILAALLNQVFQAKGDRSQHLLLSEFFTLFL